MTLANKLIQLRTKHNWTQANAAKTIDIQQSYLSKLENGHYVPSQDVIIKLCKAYKVKADELLPKSQKQFSILPSFFVILAFSLIISGYFSLFFPSNYYTYKSTPVTKIDSSINQPNFHLTDQYLGEHYLQEVSGNKYKFSLVAQRNISRKENRWLISLGSIILLLSITVITLQKKRININLT